MTVLTSRAHARLAKIASKLFTDTCTITLPGTIAQGSQITTVGTSFNCPCRGRTVHERTQGHDGDYSSNNTFRHLAEGRTQFIFEIPANTNVTTDCMVTFHNAKFAVTAVPSPYLDGKIYVQPLTLRALD